MSGTLWRLLRLVAPFWRWMGLAVVLGFLTIASSIALLATSAWIIARAALQPSIAELQVAIVGVRFFGIARGVFRYVERYVSHEATFRLLAQLRVWFYRALEPLAPARLMQYRGGDLLSRIVADVETLESFFVRALAPPLVAALIGAAMGVMMSGFDPRLAPALLVLLLAAGVGVPFLTWLLGRRVGEHLVTTRAALHVALVDGVQGMADVIAFGREAERLEQMASFSRALVGWQQRMAWISGLHGALGGLLTSLAAVAVLVIAIPRVEGIYLAALALATLASFEAVLPLPEAFQYLGNNLEAARRLFEIVDAESVVHDPPTPSPRPMGYSLVVDGLRFRYGPGEPLALDGIGFALPQGRRLAIVGASGAGKTTLVNLLLRFWDYEEGSITLGGHELRRYHQDDLRRLIGVVAQSTHLFNATVRENLTLARPDASEGEIVRATRQAHIHDVIAALPQSYETWIGEQGVRLSAGERQRLAIARALLKDAPILILDEATANLDTLTERQVLGAIHTLMEGRTTLMITHRLINLEAADEILVLQQGRVIERGRHDELLRQGGVYRQMWTLQNQHLAPDAT